jgi:ADP-heptose:LPS heptosyltransferase
LRYPLEIGRHRHRIVRIDEHLEMVLAILKHADLFLGIDSCLLHAADLFRIPGVGLFGPTDPRRWGFRLSPRSRSIWGEGTMQAIRRERVLDLLLEIAEGVEPQAEPSLCEVSRNDD